MFKKVYIGSVFIMTYSNVNDVKLYLTKYFVNLSHGFHAKNLFVVAPIESSRLGDRFVSLMKIITLVNSLCLQDQGHNHVECLLQFQVQMASKSLLQAKIKRNFNFSKNVFIFMSAKSLCKLA